MHTMFYEVYALCGMSDSMIFTFFEGKFFYCEDGISRRTLGVEAYGKWGKLIIKHGCHFGGRWMQENGVANIRNLL